MAKNKPQKLAMLEMYLSQLENSKGLILLDYTGLTPNEAVEMKMTLSGMNSNYNVVKNTIFKLALNQKELPALTDLEFGPHSVVFINEEVAGIAKKVKEYVKDLNGKLTIKAGILDGQLLSAAQVDALAEMPTKEQSVAMIAGLLTNSLSGVVNVLQDSIRSVVTIIDQAYSNK
jgi:large subunit ribosomal protein L10